MADEPMDPELAALLASLDGPPPPPPAPGAKKAAPAFGKAANNLPAPLYGGPKAPAPPPLSGPKVGSYTAAKKAAAAAPPPPPPIPGTGKASSAASSTAKANPVASLFAAKSASASPAAPAAAAPRVSSSPSAPVRSFCVYFDGEPSNSGGYGQGYDVKLPIDRNSTYEYVCEQLYNLLPWFSGSGTKYYGELPSRPSSPSQIFLKVEDWNCNRDAKMGDLGLNPMGNGASFYCTVSTPGRVVWASKGEIGGVKYMLNSGIMTVDHLFMEVAGCSNGGSAVVSTLQFLLEKGADISKPAVIKQLLARSHGTADWRDFPSVETWAFLFSNPKCPVVGIDHAGKNLIQFFASMEKIWAIKVCPVLAGRGMNPESGSGTSAKLYCTRNGWYDVIDAMDAAYKRVAGSSSSSSPAPKAASSSSGGTDPKLEAIVRALVELAVQTHDDKYLKNLREVCGAYGWRV